MDATGTKQVKIATQNTQKKQVENAEFQNAAGMAADLDSANAPLKRVRYGLPCSNCGTYYAANLTACPICSSSDRVNAAAMAKPAIQQHEATELPDADELEAERERFLREFKAQLYAAHVQINTAATFRCGLEQNHIGSFEAAAICKACYDHIQERADQMEAALHIDLKEAAQIVFDAVWADPSDPSKTYLNAAQALLTELRKRAGINMVLTTLQPYTH